MKTKITCLILLITYTSSLSIGPIMLAGYKPEFDVNGKSVVDDFKHLFYKKTHFEESKETNQDKLKEKKDAKKEEISLNSSNDKMSTNKHSTKNNNIDEKKLNQISEKIVIQRKRVYVEFDVKNLLGLIDENIIYSMNFDTKDTSVNITHIIPKQATNLKVTVSSKDVKIIKTQVKDNTDENREVKVTIDNSSLKSAKNATLNLTYSYTLNGLLFSNNEQHIIKNLDKLIDPSLDVTSFTLFLKNVDMSSVQKRVLSSSTNFDTSMRSKDESADTISSESNKEKVINSDFEHLSSIKNFKLDEKGNKVSFLISKKNIDDANLEKLEITFSHNAKLNKEELNDETNSNSLNNFTQSLKNNSEEKGAEIVATKKIKSSRINNFDNETQTNSNAKSVLTSELEVQNNKIEPKSNKKQKGSDHFNDALAVIGLILYFLCLGFIVYSCCCSHDKSTDGQHATLDHNAANNHDPQNADIAI